MFKGYFISGNDTNVGKTMYPQLVKNLKQTILNRYNVEK